jgi:hypothetical protein
LWCIIGRSLCRLIRRALSFSECLVGTYRGCAWQTEEDSFGNDPITKSVSVKPPNVTEACLYSALFCVFMARVRYNLEQIVFIYDCYVKTNSYRSCRRKFHPKFPETACPYGDTVSKLVKKVRTRVILNDRKLLKRTEEKLDDIGHRLENSSRRCLWQLAQQSGVSVGSAWKATKLLHIHPYKITVVPEIKPVDYENSEVL